MKAFLRFLLRIFFRFRACNEEVLKTPGPVLLVPNHVSWFDWLLVAACLDEDWRFVTSSRMVETGAWWMRPVIANRRTFPVDPTSPYAVRHMAEYLRNNGRLVLFAEGRISRTGCLMKLFDGTGFLLHKTNARVITCYLRGAFRLPLSPTPNQKKWFPEVTAHFSEVFTPPKLEHLGTAKARAQLTDWLRDKMVRQQFETEMELGPLTVPEAILAAARRWPRRCALEDINQRLTNRGLLVGADLLAQRFEKLLADGQRRVGVLLPTVNATPVTLLSLWFLGKAPAILNYASGTTTMLACAQLAGLKQIITSRAFIERAKLKLEPLAEAGIQFIHLEDVRGAISGARKLAALARLTFDPQSAIRPAAVGQLPNSTSVILFTSGSEGAPKGVELTHANLLANVRQMLAVCEITDADRMFNAMPLFHSFGLTVGTLVPLIRGFYVFLYPSPLHYRMVPSALYDRDCTIMLGTNTFLNGYARKAHPYDFRSVRYLFAGAEKLQESTAATWAQRFGVRVFEGYGATECSPGISVATPLAPRHGSVGRLMPGMEYRLEPVEGVVDGGRLFVRGPNVMKGYLNPDADAKFKALGGWYDTGDIVKVDAEGFVYIVGRLKRFAKISGEMVSLTAVEEALAGAFPQYGLRCQIAIVGRSDADKGEALIAVTNEPKLKLDDIRAAIRGKGLPNLCLPREVKYLRDIPRLGSGKVNHRELEKLI